MSALPLSIEDAIEDYAKAIVTHGLDSITTVLRKDKLIEVIEEAIEESEQWFEELNDI